MNTFKPASTIICIDSHGSNLLSRVNALTYLAQYVVADCHDGFVSLEGIRGEWHVMRFILAEIVI